MQRLRSSFLVVASKVLAEERRPMSARELVSVGLARGLFPDSLAGVTPHQTMKAKLSVHIRRYGDGSPFVRVAPGRFALRQFVDAEAVYEARAVAPLTSSEHVLTFPTARLESIGRFQGISREASAVLTKLAADGLVSAERIDAEDREDLKQIITYVLVTHGDRVLVYRRGNYNRVEDYLRGSMCVGFGGHVLATDLSLLADDLAAITEGAVRELREELALPADDQRRLTERHGLSLIGVLNDDSSPIGRRHFAVIFRYEAGDDPLWHEFIDGRRAVRELRGEKAIAQLQLQTFEEAGAGLREFEYWSQLCLREFFPDSIAAGPSYAIRRAAPFRRDHVLCVLGPIGSGKTEASAVLRDHFGYREVNSAAIIAGLIGLPPPPETRREVFQAAAWRYVTASRGPRRLATAIVRAVGEIDAPRTFVDGVRQRATLAALRELTPRPIAVLYVHTPPDLAFELYRDREGADLTINDFLAVRDSPVEAEASSFLADADAVLYNWHGRDAYESAVRDLFRALELPGQHLPTTGPQRRRS